MQNLRSCPALLSQHLFLTGCSGCAHTWNLSPSHTQPGYLQQHLLGSLLFLIAVVLRLQYASESPRALVKYADASSQFSFKKTEVGSGICIFEQGSRSPFNHTEQHGLGNTRSQFLILILNIFTKLQMTSL